MRRWKILFELLSVLVFFFFNGSSTLQISSSQEKHEVRPEDSAKAFARKMSENQTTSNVKIDPCQSIFCRTGRTCELDTDGRARCVCGGKDHCRGHQSQVCGSDSKIYPSHCELHRVSCLDRSKLGVDHTGKRCKGSKNVAEHKDTAVYLALPSPSTSTGFSTFDTESPGQFATLTVSSKVVVPKKRPVPSSSSDKNADCSPSDYSHFKTNLVHYHCARTGYNGCMSDNKKKVAAVTGMFEFYDRDSNKLLTPPELDLVERKDHLDRLSMSCHLRNMLAFDDTDKDQNINIDEFYKAFGIDEVPTGDDACSIYTTLVSVGNAVELKCDMPGTKTIVWKRRGHPIVSSDEVKVFEDNSLYIGELGLHHMGNYSCHDEQKLEVYQTHVIIVQMPPAVKLYPASQAHSAGSTVTIKCHAEGVPQPEIIWSKEGEVIPAPESKGSLHYFQLYSNTTLKVKSSVNSTNDSGSYSCLAKNSAGSSSETASITFIGSDAASSVNYNPADVSQIERFATFHQSGYTIYEVTSCHVEHHVFADFKLTFNRHHASPDHIPLETLCPASGGCSWGEAIMVGQLLLYVSQPQFQRVIVVEVTDRLNPIEVIEMEGFPLKMTYLDHLDQVWMTACTTKMTADSRDCPVAIVKIIHNASKSSQHSAIHANEDLSTLEVNDLFLPHQAGGLKDRFNRGYATLNSDLGNLHVIDLNSMKISDHVNLSDFQCQPRDVAYVPVGGYLFVSCEPFPGSSGSNFHLVLDYVTQNVLKRSDVGGGQIFVSPDSRNVVVLERNGSIISVYKLTADGRLNHLFDEYTQMHLNHLSFFSSETGVGYNAFAVSYTQNTVLHIELLTGKVTMIEGAEGSFSPGDVEWSQKHRKIASGGAFFEHLVTVSKTSVIAIDGQRKRIQCHWQSVNETTTFIPLPLVSE